MFDLDRESERRIEDDGEATRKAPQPLQGRLTGPSFAANSSPPWDPLSGAAAPWATAVQDPILGGGGGAQPGASADHAAPLQRSAANTSEQQMMIEDLPRWHGGVQHHAVQRKAEGAAGTEQVHAAAQQGVASGGGALPYLDRIQRSFGPAHDLSQVQAHVGGAAAEASQQIGASAYAMGSKVAFARQPDLHTAAHEAAHVVQQRQGVQLKGGVGEAGDSYEQHADAVADRVVRGESAADLLPQGASHGADEPVQRMVQRKELPEGSQLTDKDWTEAHRENRQPQWNKACETNLNAEDSSQYRRIVERRDFYRWFYTRSVEKGSTTRWALAAWCVANGAHLVGDMSGAKLGLAEKLGVVDGELQAMMRLGNQVIFDNVLPKLHALDRNPLQGQAALDWDKKILAEEQQLVQKLYDGLSKGTKDKLEAIARKKPVSVKAGAYVFGDDKVEQLQDGKQNNINDISKKPRVIPFDHGDISRPEGRWRYGMDLGKTYAPGGTQYDPAKDSMPQVDSGYQDGSELAKVTGRRYISELEYNLNDLGDARISLVKSSLASLTEPEKQELVRDTSSYGWAYSERLAMMPRVPRTDVFAALPADPASAAAVAAFKARYNQIRPPNLP